MTISLGPALYESGEYSAGGFSAFIDDTDSLVKVVISNASRFIGRALAAGVEVEGTPQVEPGPKGRVWYDADSSMIST
ncbi:MAG: hypothetical protein M5U01_22895 [Ardenticatenaceae bacterium]|nr:hypothetical protein [Ardenticatenaceae bacterium]HBY99015.1 hypothetical protein [Chloroflexota bacterium]